MNELDSIRYKKEMMNEWLNEHTKKRELVRLLERDDISVGYTWEAGSEMFGYRDEFVGQRLSESIRNTMLIIAQSELNQFEEKGFENWLIEREKENE